jgi:GNAT superfamily N-acetyltransferase
MSDIHYVIDFNTRIQAKLSNMNNFNVHFLSQPDRKEWRALFEGYAGFYGIAMNDATANKVWDWLLDANHVLEGLLVRDVAEYAIGFIHFRSCPRSLGGCDIGFVEDMYVLPGARGSGAADTLFERLKELAAEHSWPAIRWATQHSNQRGRAFYDRYTSGPSDFIMYHWQQSM